MATQHPPAQTPLMLPLCDREIDHIVFPQ
jgi:hypothetical protein